MSRDVSARASRLGLGLGLGLLLFAAASAPAQRVAVETFTVGDGLPSAEIYDLEEGPSGRLFILTRAGLVVYDGRGLDPPSAVGGLPAAGLVELDVDPGGRMWAVARPSGMGTLVAYYLLNGVWHALPTAPAHGTPALGAIRMAATGDGDLRVTIGSRGGGIRVWDGARWAVLDETGGLPSDIVYDFAKTGDGLAVATESGLCGLRGTEVDCRPRELDRRLREEIYALHREASTGRLWMFGPTWLGTLEGQRLVVLEDDLDLRNFHRSQPGALAVDRVGGVTFGNPNAAYFRDPIERRVRLMAQPEGWVAEGVTALLEDREGNLWVGSLRGLTRVSSRRFLSFGPAHGLLDAEVTAIAEPSPGRLVLGHNAGLTFFDGERAETVAFGGPEERPVNADRVLDLEVDRDGSVWAAAHELGLLRLGADGTWARQPFERAAYSVELDGRGRLWVTGRSELFVREDAGFARVVPGLTPQGTTFYRWLEAAPGGGLFVATRGGLLAFDGEVWNLARGPTPESDDVFAILERRGGEVWAGTAAGLYRRRGGELAAVTVAGLELRRPVYFLLEDPRGRVWLGTDDGVRVWDGERSRHLTLRHGLAGRETNRGAALVDHRGRVWIGTEQGLSVYQEHYDAVLPVPPGVEITAVEAGGRVWPPAAGIDLDHRQSTLSFQLATIAFSREEEALYRYRLDGFDDAWQGPAALSGTEIRYTNVPPGRFRFHIAGRRGDGAWSREATSGPITVARPFWRRAWFYVLTGAALAFAVLGVHGLRTRAIRARNRELEALTVELADSIAERQRLIDDLEDKNRELERFTYTVSHDLKSPLVTIKGFLGLLKKDSAAGDAERTHHDVERIAAATATMGRLLDELLELSRIGRVVHEPETVPFAELAREAVDSVAGALAERDVEVDVAADLPAVRGDRVRLLEVLQNLVENAAKFMGDQPAPRIEIGARVDGAEPVFVVRDNGIGIDPRYRERVFVLFERLDQGIEGTGVGLTLVQRIVEVHGGRIWIESEGKGRGTAFCFTLPMG